MTKGIALKLIPSLMLAAFAGTAGASGFQLIEQNASGLGNAYAGSAANAENASTIFYNPAGMTQLQGLEVSAGGVMVKPTFKLSNGSSSVPGNGTTIGGVGTTVATPLYGTGGDGGDAAFLPNGYLSWGVTKDLYVGVGFGAPFGLMTEYEPNWLGAAQSIKFDIKTYNINPSVAYRINDKFSIGGGVNYMRMTAEYVKLALPASSITAGNFATPVATLQASDNSWGWNIGGTFTPSASTKVGVSYRSAVKQELDGTLKVDAVGALATSRTSIGARADIKLPDTLIVSAAQKLSDRWELLGDVSWTGWGKVPKVDIISKGSGATVQTLNTDFKNTWRVALGANYALSDAVTLKTGLAYDQTPVRNADHRLVSLPDNDRVWLSLGAQFRLSKDSRIDLGGAYLYVKDAKINATSQANANPNSVSTVNGTFKDSAYILGAQYSLAF